MTEVLQGTSLARFGDGELLIMGGKDAAHQKYDASLRIELLNILDSSPCLVGIPDVRGERFLYWGDFLNKYLWSIPDFSRDRWYGSSFVSRADEVEWDRVYHGLMKSILIADPRPICLAPANHPFNELWDHVVCPLQDAYAAIDEIETELMSFDAREIILCCGPTATVLADRLTRKGIWAVDLGNFGKFL